MSGERAADMNDIVWSHVYVLLMICAARAQSLSHHHSVSRGSCVGRVTQDVRVRRGYAGAQHMGRGGGQWQCSCQSSGTSSSMMAARGVIMKRWPWIGAMKCYILA